MKSANFPAVSVAKLSCLIVVIAAWSVGLMFLVRSLLVVFGVLAPAFFFEPVFNYSQIIIVPALAFRLIDQSSRP